MKAKGGEWTYDELSHFIANPRGYIPGTNMTFAGLPRDSQRADVIAYLRTLADSPLPLPKAAAAPAAPAQGGQAGQGGQTSPAKPAAAPAQAPKH